MPTVFISYARDDLPVVEKLASALLAHGMTVWRDQDSLYGGQQWPQAIGEAIDTHDVLLLVWSRHAARSHYVEFEWNTALALKTTVLPCWLDDTPLPPALRAVNGIDLGDFDAALPKILRTLQHHVGHADPAHSAAVLATLHHLPATDPAEAVQALQTTFAQAGWHVQGNIYQAAGDLHLTVEPPAAKPQKTVVEKWQLWVALVVGVLTIVSLMIDLPKKIPEVWQSKSGNVQIVQTLSGIVWDEQRQLLGNVEIFIADFNLTTTTDARGRFALQVTAPKQQSVRVIARKQGYITYDAHATLGNPSLSFIMRQQP